MRVFPAFAVATNPGSHCAVGSMGKTSAMSIEIKRYGNRYWSIWLHGELIAVTVYKKGAVAVAHLITSLRAGIIQMM